MKKIPNIFIRGADGTLLVGNINPICKWVFAGEGIATRKYDGTCCLIEGGKLYKRRMIKPNKRVPLDFKKEDYDPNTGKIFGWMPVDIENKQDKWHAEAWDNQEDGTYELCGPKLQGNPEKYDKHTLVSHNMAEVYEDCPRNTDDLKKWLSNIDIEGIVFRHPDGRMAKIRKTDFNQKR